MFRELPELSVNERKLYRLTQSFYAFEPSGWQADNMTLVKEKVRWNIYLMSAESARRKVARWRRRYLDIHFMTDANQLYLTLEVYSDIYGWELIST